MNLNEVLWASHLESRAFLSVPLRNLTLINQTHSPSSQILLTTNLPSASVDLPVLDITQKCTVYVQYIWHFAYDFLILNIFFKHIHAAGYISNLIPFCGIIFSCMNILHLIFSFFSWWTFGLLLLVCPTNIYAQGFCNNISFILSCLLNFFYYIWKMNLCSSLWMHTHIYAFHTFSIYIYVLITSFQ